MLWARQWVTMVKTKERQVDDERVPPMAMLRTYCSQRSCNSWRARLCALDVVHSMATSLVVRLTRWFPSCDAWWNKLLSGRYQFL